MKVVVAIWGGGGGGGHWGWNCSPSPNPDPDQVRLEGTDADLRKLTTDDCVRWLAPHGYTAEQVTKRKD